MAVCESCGDWFVQQGPWQKTCKPCFAARKKAEHAGLVDQVSSLCDEVTYWRDRALAAESRKSLDPDMLRRLVRLCHPDRHNGSQAAHAATVYLLGLRRANSQP